MYDLVAVVIHCGSGPNRGHYISIVKSCGFWLIFDDDIVDVEVDTNVEGTTYMIAEDIVTGDDDNVSDDVTGVVEVDVFGELGKLVELKHITY